MFQDAVSGDNFKPKKFNFALMILKMFIKTPLYILKGLVEQFDPNISLALKVVNIIRMAVALLPESAPDELKECVSSQLAAQMSAFPGGVDAFLIEEGWPEGDAKGYIQFRLTELDNAFKGIKADAVRFIDSFPFPMVCIAMLPSMVPYGVGFPIPPLGPGIGPPITPMGLIYLVLELWDDKQLFPKPDSSPRNKNKLSAGTNIKIPSEISALCKEKLEKWQQIAALGLIDSEPPEEDSD
jgi:hypothetical protein